MQARGSGLCTLALLAWLMGTACPRGLPLSGLVRQPLTSQNGSGFPVVSLQWLSVRVPFLTAAWTLVALSSLLGKQPASV
jgi:hypothetical protein